MMDIECPRCKHYEEMKGIIQPSILEIYPPEHSEDCEKAND